MITSFEKDKLKVKVFETRASMGIAAAEKVAAKIIELLGTQKMVNIIFAAAPSQNEFLAALVQHNLPWQNINAFHMDEYVNLKEEAPQGFGNFLREHIFNKVNFNMVNFLNGNATSLQEECRRYEKLLQQYPADIVCMGIGENTHIAFNDPHAADFTDPRMVKVVDLDDACRQQQVNDDCFAEKSGVPTHALTLTVPALMGARFVYCIVPGIKKAQAIAHTINDEISEKYPSTVLRNHLCAELFIDKDSASLVPTIANWTVKTFVSNCKE